MSKLKAWFSQHDFLFILAAGLLVFIPLYPKLPLADIIPGYLVRLRLEDLLVLFVSLVWLWQWWRKKIAWNTVFFWLITAYLVIGVASIFSGLLLNHTIPFSILHLGKSSLHLFRYAEYFALFVIGFSAVTSPKQLNVLFRLLLLVVIGITLYGAGQKYLQWPVYSTMNREYAKGEALTLGEHAKVQSTFGGHYDLAAFLVIVLPILFAYFLATKKIATKLFILTVELGGWWMLVLSGSKTSLLAVGLAHAVVIFLHLQARGFFKKLHWLGLVKLGVGTFVVGLGLLLAISTFNQDMAASFLNLASKVPVANLLIKRLAPTQASSDKPQDWIVAEPIYEEKKIVLDNGDEAIELVKKELEWSDNALKYGISMGIRLDTLWPNALTGLRRNPYLGSSYGNLNKPALTEFTDSDSTDNNYLRTLGETGLLGFLTFYGLIILLILTLLKVPRAAITPASVFAQALIGGAVGLAFNAVYIDVFAASKVAFVFWLLAGVTLKGFYLAQPDLAKKLDHDRWARLKKAFRQHWPLLIAALLLGLLTWRNPYLDEFTLLNKFNFSGDDYQNLVLARCLSENNLFSLCRNETSGATGLPINFSPLYALILVPIYSVLTHPNAYYFVNYLLFNLTLILVYLSLRKLIKNRLVEFFLLSLFVLNPFFRETVFKSTSTNLIMWSIAMLVYLKLLLISRLKRVYSIFFNHPATAATLIFGGLLLTGGLLKHYHDPLFKDFAQDEKTHLYRTIKRANLSFTHQLKNPPYLITAINPYFFDLYGNGHYQLLPYTPQQELFSQAPLVWGDFDFDYQAVTQSTDLAPLYTQILQSQPLYFTNYAIGDFAELRRRFSFKTLDLDCEEHCNIYQLSTKIELPKLLEPTVYNNRPLTNLFADFQTQPQQPINFTIVGHTYPNLSLPENQTPLGQAERYNELQLAQRLTTLLAEPLAKSADFLVFLGDLTTRQEDGRFGYFDWWFTRHFTKPIINAHQTVKPKSPDEYYQPFILGDNYFLRLKTVQSDRLAKAELIKFYNLFYDLEFSEVDYLFIFSYQDLRQNQDFMEKIAPLLNQLSNKSIYLFSDGVDGQKVANQAWPSHLGNITFVTTGFNENEPATGIVVKIDPVTGVTLQTVSE